MPFVLFVLAQVFSKIRRIALALGLAAITSAPAANPEIQVKDGQKVAFLGDSITAAGWGSKGGYVQLVVDALGKNGIKIIPIPAGVGGNTSQDMLARLDNDVLSKQPDWMTLSCGVNDVWHGATGVDLETYKKNITSIVDQAQAKGIKVVILTSTPISEEPNSNNEKLAAYNDFLRQLAQERKLPLADLSADFLATLKPLPTSPDSRFLTIDGVHMNAEGNVLMAKGVLGAFGVSPMQLAQIEKAWLTQPDTASVTVYPFDPRPEIGLKLGQFRALNKIAESRKVSGVQFVRSIWLRSLSKVVQAHASNPILDPEQIKNETNLQLAKDIQAITRLP
ncbi:MAG TPA: SGNH/GDSL hydrolase family protein [Chthoniobacterales bacterium]|nr:SGNH/GDSL hydrolase family protein [Chthoniobacterales bacterium]